MEHKQLKKSSLALAGIIVGAIGVLLSAVPIINNFAFVLAVVALVFGITALVSIKRGRRSGKGMAIAAIILAVLGIVIVLASQAFYASVLNTAGKEAQKAANQAQDDLDRSSGKKTSELLKTDVDVTIGTFATSTDQYGLVTTELPVTVKNKNVAAKSYGVQIEAVDKQGNRIADDTVTVSSLASGQSQKLKAFQYVESGKVEALKTATFKVVQVSQY